MPRNLYFIRYEAVGQKTILMVDSGFSSGLDIVRGLALGAKFVFCGRAFMWGISALGERGVDHVAICMVP